METTKTGMLSQTMCHSASSKTQRSILRTRFQTQTASLSSLKPIRSKILSNTRIQKLKWGRKLRWYSIRWKQSTTNNICSRKSSRKLSCFLNNNANKKLMLSCSVNSLFKCLSSLMIGSLNWIRTTHHLFREAKLATNGKQTRTVTINSP